jgi:hypothetical protein
VSPPRIYPLIFRQSRPLILLESASLLVVKYIVPGSALACKPKRDARDKPAHDNTVAPGIQIQFQ